VSYAGETHPIAQANNAPVFPGLWLRTIVTRARTVSDGMLAAAAVAKAAIDEGLAGLRLIDLEGEIQRAMWQPVYRPVVAS
jgi:malate dehydrogenase (oxaloacetate-decarboxylating)